MATQYGFGKIATDGLVLCLDAGNPRSYQSGSTTWFDMSGNGNSGSLVNGPAFTGSNGGAIVFDGINDYINCGTTPQITGLTNVSVCAWAYPATASSNFYVSRYFNTTAENGFLLSSTTGDTSTTFKLLFSGRENSSGYLQVTSSISYPINNWYYLSGTKSGSLWSIYVNGSLVATASLGVGTIAFGVNNTQVGAVLLTPNAATELYSKTNIAIAKLYSRALSAQEVLQNYNATKTRFGL